jgi:hypothetical protein
MRSWKVFGAAGCEVKLLVRRLVEDAHSIGIAGYRTTAADTLGTRYRPGVACARLLKPTPRHRKSRKYIAFAGGVTDPLPILAGMANHRYLPQRPACL